MSYDEKTTEIEIPGLTKKKDNIVRVDFSNTPQVKRSATSSVAAVTSIPLSKTADEKGWDPMAPWLLRLAAVLAVLILSLLIL